MSSLDLFMHHPAALAEVRRFFPAHHFLPLSFLFYAFLVQYFDFYGLLIGNVINKSVQQFFEQQRYCKAIVTNEQFKSILEGPFIVRNPKEIIQIIKAFVSQLLFKKHGLFTVLSEE